MNTPTPKPDLLEETPKLINEHLSKIIGCAGRYETRGMALKLLRIGEPNAELAKLVSDLFKQICDNWKNGGENDRGKNNWRWEPRSKKPGRGETKTERDLMCAGNGTPSTERWANQIPTGSGLSPVGEETTDDIDTNKKKKRAGSPGHIDLAYCDGTGRLMMIEFKLNADNPVFAALQLVRYALVLILAREKHLKIKDSRWRDTKKIDLRVLAPSNFDRASKEQFYDKRYLHIGWFEKCLHEAVKQFGKNHDLELSFGFRAFDLDSPPKSEADLLRCLERAIGGT